jgi:hypothetical protein
MRPICYHVAGIRHNLILKPKMQFKERVSMKWKFVFTWFSCLTLALFLGGAPTVAQTVTGSVRGIVTDSSGAVVAGATVTVTNIATGVAARTLSDQSGVYNVGFLVLGDYTVIATAPGFETASIGPFHVQIDQIVTADPKLSVGKASTTVNVTTDQSLLLNTENSTISTSISNNILDSMPLGAQNVQIATLMVPGAYNFNSSSMTSAMGFERDAYQQYSEPGDDQPSFNGNRQQANNYTLDGIDINESINNSLGYNASPYSLAETHVITQNADAEFGNVAGGDIIMVTKNGTNHFHGSAFLFHESSGLEANSWANKNYAVPLRRMNFGQEQFGAAVGGPIFKNKLFFFGNYIGSRYTVPPSQKIWSVPTAAERGLAPTTACPAGNADLSQVLAIDNVQLYDTSNGTANETPYANNCIPIVNPVAKFLYSQESEKIWPLPNAAPRAGTYTANNYVGQQASKTNNDQGDIRLDYTVNSRDTLMGKYTYGEGWDVQSETAVEALFPSSNDYPITSSVIAWTHVFSPAVVNNVRAGYTRIFLHQGGVVDPSGVFGLKGDSLLGIPLANQSIPGFTWLTLGTSDMRNIGTQVFPFGGFSLDNNFDYNDTLTWEHGKHIIKFGAQFLRYEQNYFTPGSGGGLNGTFTYNGKFTGPKRYGMADFDLDMESMSQITNVTGPFGQRQWRDAAFVQDDWKILPNLTLNLGLRYAYDQPNYEVNNKMVNVNIPLATGAAVGTPVNSLLEYAGQYNPSTGKVNSRALYNPYYFDIEPRVGFAWKLTPKLVLHGGYGSSQFMESTGTGWRMTQNAAFQPSAIQLATPPSATNGGTAFHAANGFGPIVSGRSLAGDTYYAWDPNLRPAVFQQFTLTTQYQIDNHTSVQAGYVGQVGQHLAINKWINQYSADDTCSGISNGPQQDACYEKIEPFYALVGNSSSIDVPGSGVLIDTASQAASKYNALQVTLQRQQSNGLEFLLNYTFGKSLSNNIGFYGVDGAAGGGGLADWFPQDNNNFRGDYGPTTSDIRHMVSGTAVYELPFGHGKQFGANWNRLIDEGVGGWKLSANIRLYSGTPLSINSGSGCNNNCAGAFDNIEHANQYAPMKIVGRGTNAEGVFKWFGTDASAQPCTIAGTSPTDNPSCAYGMSSADFGNAHIGTERGPGFRNIDLSLFKGFRTVGSQSIKARIDAFNAFNIASYGNPNTSIGSNNDNFGAITGTQSAPRQLQISAIYEF